MASEKERNRVQDIIDHLVRSVVLGVVTLVGVFLVWLYLVITKK